MLEPGLWPGTELLRLLVVEERVSMAAADASRPGAPEAALQLLNVGSKAPLPGAAGAPVSGTLGPGRKTMLWAERRLSVGLLPLLLLSRPLLRLRLPLLLLRLPLLLLRSRPRLWSRPLLRLRLPLLLLRARPLLRSRPLFRSRPLLLLRARPLRSRPLLLLRLPLLLLRSRLLLWSRPQLRLRPLLLLLLSRPPLWSGTLLRLRLPLLLLLSRPRLGSRPLRSSRPRLRALPPSRLCCTCPLPLLPRPGPLWCPCPPLVPAAPLGPHAPDDARAVASRPTPLLPSTILLSPCAPTILGAPPASCAPASVAQRTASVARLISGMILEPVCCCCCCCCCCCRCCTSCCSCLRSPSRAWIRSA